MTLGISFDLPPQDALDWFRQKGLAVSFDWRDMLHEQHTLAFTVAKMANVDLLADVRQAVDAAISEGQTLAEFRAGLAPLLKSKGWWGKQDMLDPATGEVKNVQLGSPRRLRTIFETNLKTSYAAGHWAQIQQSKAALPYLMYDAINDSHTRPQHRAWDNLVLTVDDPWWNTHYPPNGWHCRCGVIQLTPAQLKTMGKTEPDPAPADQMKAWTNPRTGATELIPEGIDPGWAYHPGRDQATALEKWVNDRLAALPERIKAKVQKSLATWGKSAASTKAAITRRENLMRKTLGKFNIYKGGAQSALSHRGIKWPPILSDAEGAAIYGYTYDLFEKINPVLRGEGDWKQELKRLKPVVDTLDSALVKMPVYNGWTTRGANLPAEQLAIYKEGAIISEAAYTSASREWKHFGGNARFHILSKTGRIVDSLSAHPREMEVLFRRGTHFKVANPRQDGDIIIIKMMEI